MSVTMHALGVWDVVDVTTGWQQYDLLISEPVGDDIDFYPLSDETLYVEKLQLTYGKVSYEWRPAPEDDVEYEWTRVALDEVTVANIRDIVSYTEYYYLAAAGEPAPAKPTTNPPPSSWTVSQTLDEAYMASATISPPDGGITAADVDAVTFAHAVNGAAGVYRYTYNGASWTDESGEVISLRDYGIMVAGTPTAGDSVAVSLGFNTNTVLYQCAMTLYSDGSFTWGDVTVSAAYDAAKAALSTSTKYQTQVQQLLDSWDVKVQAAIIDEDTQETVKNMLGRIQVTESTVSNLIDETRQTSDGLSERITSLQVQTNQNITNTFTEAKQYADDQYGGTKEYVVTAQSWQRFSADGIEQGKLGSPFKSKLTNSELGFYENDQKVAYINNNRFMIHNGVIEDSLVIGNFEFTSSNNGLGIIFNGSGGSGS